MCPEAALDCESSKEIRPVEGIIGQDRALQALRFGLEMKGKGFNVYAAGQPGTGKNTAVRQILRSAAKDRPVPPDRCYVNNFREPYEPRALSLPPGKARELQRDLRALVAEAQRAIPAALQGDDFVSKRGAAARRADEERARVLEALNGEAAGLGFAVQVSQAGISITPVAKGKPLSDEAIAALPAAAQEAMRGNREAVAAQLDRAVKRLADLDARTRAEIRKLQDDAVRYAIGHLAEALVARYRDLPSVSAYLEEMQRDILESTDLFVGGEAAEGKK